VPDATRGEELFENRFLILEELGTGGMGKVYRAQQVDANREVALKVLLNTKIEDADAVARFKNEFKLHSQLSHPNIVTVYGMAIDKNGKPYAFCELLNGFPLSRVLEKEGKLSWQRALKITIQICEAMQYMHDKNVLHRDLKPDNIMLVDKPEPDFVKILDFGLSRIVDGNTQGITATGKILGTASYASPEQSWSKADRRSDIYSVACILFELLSGDCLFPADSPAASILKHATEDPLTRFDAINSRIPAELFTVMLRALAKDPEQRTQSMNALADSLEKIIESEGVLLNGKRFQSEHDNRNPINTWLALAAFSLLLGCAAFVLLQHNRFELKAQVHGINDSLDLMYKAALSAESKGDASLAVKRLEVLFKRYKQQRKIPKAAEIQERILKIEEQQFGVDSPKLLESISALVDLCGQTSDTKAKEGLLKRLIIIKQKTFGIDCVQQTTELRKLAELLQAEEEGKTSEAKTLLKQEVKILETQKEADSAELSIALELLGKCYEREDETATAIVFFQRAVAVRDSMGEVSTTTSVPLQHIADCYEKQKQWLAAESIRKELLVFFEKKYATNYPDFYSPIMKTEFNKEAARPIAEITKGLILLSDNLCAQHKFKEAIPLYQRAITIVEKTAPQSISQISDLKRRLANCSLGKK